MTPPGTLYPFNLVFLLFGLRLGFPAIAVIHLITGGAGAYALCREYGVGRVAALCGALAFIFSVLLAVHLAAWLPSANLGTWVWLPVAVCLLERLLKRPTLLGAQALAAVLGLQLLAGSPQIAFFTDQVIALRVFWQLAARQVPRPWRVLVALVCAVLLAVGLAAVQLLPSLEFSRRIAAQPPAVRQRNAAARGSLLARGADIALLGDVCARHLARGRGARHRGMGGPEDARGRGVLFADRDRLRAPRCSTRGCSTSTCTCRWPCFRMQTRFSYIVTFAISVLVGLGAEAILAAGAQRLGRAATCP